MKNRTVTISSSRQTQKTPIGRLILLSDLRKDRISRTRPPLGRCCCCFTLSYLDTLIGDLGMDFHDRLDEIVDHFATLLVTDLLDIVEFLLGVLLGLLLGGLVA